MPAMSTKAGPQVVSCINTRPGRNGISSSLRPSCQPAQDCALRTWQIIACCAQDIFEHDAKDMRQPFEVATSRGREVDNPIMLIGDRDGGHSASAFLIRYSHKIA